MKISWFGKGKINTLEGWFLGLSTRDAIKLYIFSSSVLRDGNLSYNRWAGHGKFFSRPAYKKLMDIFIARGWVIWKNPEVKVDGVCLTKSGQVELKYIINQAVKTTEAEIKKSLLFD
jgi:pantothenate kinase-related protein Tda10